MPKKKAKKKRKQEKHFWLTRDASSTAPYNAHLEEPAHDHFNPHTKQWELDDDDDQCLCVSRVEPFSDESVHLEPGGGPIKVKLVRAR